MRKINFVLCFLLLVLNQNQTMAAVSAPLRVDIKNSKGQSIGTAMLTEDKDKKGVSISMNVKNLSPGSHAFHFHEKSLCQAPAFESAGGHFNPESKKHGAPSPGGGHAGDMPNLTVGPDGTGKIEFVNQDVTLKEGKNSLLRNGGTALVIHAEADDFKSQPAGNAGDRVACGEITKPVITQ